MLAPKLFHPSPNDPCLLEQPRTRTHGPTLKVAVLRTLVLCLLLASIASAQGMATLRGLEARLLEKRLNEYEAADRRARTAERQYTTLRQRLSGVLGDSEVSLEQLRALEAETSLARESAFLRDREATTLRREIYHHLERIQEMDKELDALGPRLDGTWNIDFGQQFGSGKVTFRMNGERVDGTYRLTNGAAGQIRGELIGRNVALVRYNPGGDQQLQFRGQLSADSRSMAGDWVATELAGGGQALGYWSARRAAP